MAKKKTTTSATPKEIQQKIAKIQRKLYQVEQCREIMQLDNHPLDENDIAQESRLRKELWKLEKMAAGKWVSDEDYRGPDKPPKRSSPNPPQQQLRDRKEKKACGTKRP